MMPCNFCSPMDVRGERCLSDAQGKRLLGLKQVGKTKYKKNSFDYERIYRCQDCGALWKMVGTPGKTPGYHDEPVLRIVR